jgi:hypothetical protein
VGSTLAAPIGRHIPHDQGDDSDATLFRRVVPADVVYDFSAADPRSYRNATLQCQGTNYYFWKWNSDSAGPVEPQPNPLHGTDTDGTPFTAFSVVPSPGERDKLAFQWDLRMTDPDTAGSGAKRCEFSFGWKEYSYPGKSLTRQISLPANQDTWWAVAVNTEDWSETGHSNDWQVLWQWHDAFGGGLPPFLSLAVHGAEWQLQMAYDPARRPTNSTLKKRTLWTADVPPNTWARFVVKARKNLLDFDESDVQVWLNGKRIVSYHGPFGYNVPQDDFAKVGIYHWISQANVWDPTVPARRMWSKGPVQVNDRAGYTWQSIDALLD